MNKMSGLDEMTIAMTKGIETTANIAQGMGITYDEEILMKTFQYSPLLQFLEGKGRCTDVKTANVAFFKEEPTNTAQYIAEGTSIPAFGETTYTEVADRMKELVEGISVSELAQDGTDTENLVEREITRAYLQINSMIDYTLLQGAGTQAAKDFKNIMGDIPNANKATVTGGAVTEDDIDDMLVQIVDENGGHPDVIVTDNFVAKQLKKIAAPYRRYNDKVDIGIGFRVSTIESPDGMEIPVLVDKNMPSGTNANPSHKMLFLDSSCVDVKYLHRPGVKMLAANNLADNLVVRTHVTAMNIAPFRCGVIEGITTPSTAAASEGSGSGS